MKISRFAYLAVLVVLLAGAILSVRGKADDTALPQAGQTAPDFTLPSQDGSNISLDSFRGKWVVLYFYPKDMTTGCTIEAHNFQQDMEKYQKLNAVVVGVSVDSTGSHKEFCAKEGLSFKLLSDQDKKVVAQYGSMADYKGVKIAKRNTFLIDPARKNCPGMDWRQPLAAQPAGFGRAERLREKRLTATPEEPQVLHPPIQLPDAKKPGFSRAFLLALCCELLLLCCLLCCLLRRSLLCCLLG